ncbi:Com family DNA-binding transcriptional regulator [Acinetobacter baumannii]|uniref:Com family DNA-binding transcriptional regulator n=1 Tax=Acinetobacter TaxID=469 RepID=UPI0009A24CD5|nr:Com family DNA-binding transcriptional regulator [Acinetobacter baumannii]EKW8719649.1 Com family DNA-binding transcriptional regulator [Acinetobacter baumannii]ELB7302415.1 Com family DNA-binding transcriptional regulator [Acinetobacter baumannii]MBD0452345.1 Com family DNA-binding transcriptional regulator [Acinetobacter baumannii]MBF1849307.1 Com family DNA-binding transcriptional regulator [Acinetobacter baumannii]
MHTIRCRCCYKLLAKIGHFDSLEIKCSRCKSINILSTESALPESLEHPKTGKNHEYSIQPKRS